MRFFTSVHLLLLAYIVAAIVFWELRLQELNGRVYAQQVITLKSQVDSLRDPVTYNQEMGTLNHNLSMGITQYVGEGSSFLIVILIGAVIVYSSFRRSILLSRQQNNFMLSVTHELKSPIAAMKLNLQTLEKHQLTDEQKNKLLARSIQESNRLNDLCNNMLLASQMEGRQYKQIRETFNISEVAGDTIKDYAARYPRKFTENITPDLMVEGDKVMLQMALNNLLENAVKYTPTDKPVSISLHRKQNNVILQVLDEGTGIPDAEKKKIFNKFYRIGSEESRNAKGTGLGLYLTNKIVHQHKGRITIKDNTPSGAIFEICLPA